MTGWSWGGKHQATSNLTDQVELGNKKEDWRLLLRRQVQ
jgi:hypothetical protein